MRSRLAEQLRYDELLAAPKRAANALEPPPLAVWVEGGVARGDDRPGDPVVMAVVDSGRYLPKTTEMLRKAVQRLERKLDIQIEVRGRTVPDLEMMPAKDGETLGGAISLLGVPPAGLLDRDQVSASAQHSRPRRSWRKGTRRRERHRGCDQEGSDGRGTGPQVHRTPLTPRVTRHAENERSWPNGNRS